MKAVSTGLIIAAMLMCGCGQKECDMAENDKEATGYSLSCEAKNNRPDVKLACKLTSAELQQRKATILESLKKQVIEKKELANGYAFKFAGTDNMVDELAAFIKTEMECCDFFTFNLSVSGDKSEAWLELKGPDGAKDFIESELQL